MASQGPLYPAVGLTIAGSAPETAEAWVNPGNIVSDNASEATITAATYDSPDVSQQLRGRNFGFTIPTGATIDGVIVEIERRSIIANSGKDYRVQLVDPNGGSPILMGNNKADTSTIWPTSATVATYGSSTDTWGASLTATMLNDAFFSVAVACQANIANADVGVDFIRVTVHYTAGENHNGTVTATGGGVAAVGASKGAQVTLTHVGGGVYVQVKTTNRNRANPLTGGGVLAIGDATARNLASVLTGGGVVSVTQLTARELASLLTGGGVLVVAGSGSSSESHSGAAQLTAGGLLAIMQASGRFASITLTASGKLELLGGQIALSDLGTIMQGIADRLVAEGVAERAYGWPVEDMTTPCIVVGFPDRIEYDATYGRGADVWFIPVYFVCGRITTKAARDTMAAVVTGAVSVKEKLDGNLGGLVDTLRVTDMRILNVNIAGIDYLSALFDTEIYS